MSIPDVDVWGKQRNISFRVPYIISPYLYKTTTGVKNKRR